MHQETVTSRTQAYLTKYPKAPLDIRVQGDTVFGIGSASEAFMSFMGRADKFQIDKAIREVTQQIGRPLTVTVEPVRSSSGRDIYVTKYEIAPFNPPIP